MTTPPTHPTAPETAEPIRDVLKMALERLDCANRRADKAGELPFATDDIMAAMAQAEEQAAELARLRDGIKALAEDLSTRSAHEFGLGNRITADVFLEFATAARALAEGSAR